MDAARWFANGFMGWSAPLVAQDELICGERDRFADIGGGKAFRESSGGGIGGLLRC